MKNRYVGPWPPSNSIVKKTILTNKFKEEGIMTTTVKKKKTESSKLKEILTSMDERNQYIDTPAYKYGYEQGESQGDYLATEYHKEMIYRLVKQMTMDITHS